MLSFLSHKNSIAPHKRGPNKVPFYFIKLVTKPGQCPKQEGGLCDSGWTCTDDNQCPRDLKCCSNECGGTCLPPVTLIPNQSKYFFSNDLIFYF